MDADRSESRYTDRMPYEDACWKIPIHYNNGIWNFYKIPPGKIYKMKKTYEIGPTCVVPELDKVNHRNKRETFVSYYYIRACIRYNLGSTDLTKFNKQDSWMRTGLVSDSIELYI